MMDLLPRDIRPKAPPVKTQGIKTRLVPLMARSIRWHGNGRWIEPFLGSGAVALNIAPQRAILSDTNAHVVNLHRSIQKGTIDGSIVRQHLRREGALLLERGERRYYAVRERFNEADDSLDFLFPSRSCFNGMMRFNRAGGFNVPFCRRPERFRPALMTKIVNRIEWARSVMVGKDWQFAVQDWRTTLEEVQSDDIVHCDPPHVGRHTDYYNGFTDDDGDELAKTLVNMPANFALSMWLENRYRRNAYVDRWFSRFPQYTMAHFHHVGPRESLRNAMTEVVIVSEDAAAPSRVPSIPLRTLLDSAEDPARPAAPALTPRARSPGR